MEEDILGMGYLILVNLGIMTMNNLIDVLHCQFKFV